MDAFKYCTIFWFVSNCVPMISTDEFRLAYMSGDRVSTLDFSHNGAAPTLAVERATQEGILANNTMKILYKDGSNKKLSMGYVIEMYEKEKVDGFIGIGIASVLRNTGYLMAHWNLPAFSQAATDPSLKDKTNYKTLMRLAPTFNKVGDVVSEITKHFAWKHVGIVSNSRALCRYSMSAVFTELSDNGVVIPYWIKFDGQLDDTLLTIVSTIRSKSRIVVFCGASSDKTAFMIGIHKANLTTPEYVYIMPPFRVLDGLHEPWKDYSNPNRDILLEASRSILQISMFSLDNWKIDTFLDDHASKMMAMWNYNLTAEGQTTSSYAMLLYDSTYLYALALNKTLEDGEDPKNGSRIVEKARGLTFEGVSGHVAFDENGDRDPTCSLWYVRSGESISRLWAKAVLSNPAGERMEVIDANIWRTESGSAPPDVPKCGFMGENCRLDDRGSLVLVLTLVLGGILVAVAVITITLFLRKRWSDQRLKELLWKVDFAEMSFIDGSSFPRRLGSGLLGTGFSSSYISSTHNSSMACSRWTISELDPREKGQMFNKVAMYKGQLVSVKPVHSIQANEHDELLMIAALRHENVNPFIGACVQEDHFCVLTLYCQKGSLEDLLETESIQLDNIFKESLLFDLVNGMVYLHSSPIKSHGNLKSSNCLIDSRWVLRITDYSPQCFLKKSVHDLDDYELYRDKLWTAPELLRAHDRTSRGSPQEDVFAFSIVMQEILYRALPYFMGDSDTPDISPKDIVEKVMLVRVPPFRPICPKSAGVKEAFVGLMQQCWEETPHDRPTFLEIKRALGRTSEMGKINVMDRIIQKLESYSNNLEDIVRERTEELREEKRKTDSLLYQMLPSVVADKLKQGAYVSPQLYDQATVYFSDILGFVEMAAESSPLEVVTVLNDLYEMLDNLITGYDVYKVETIGDSYMVCSGIPVPNGRQHVAEIADMSLHILLSAKTFQIRHRPGETIQLRVGFHTGPCCAGVVGLAMPRYCLFGDTVNTASRMESNSQALKIHVSSESALALAKFGIYRLAERGEMFIKGKGLLTTYWLEGKRSRLV